MAALRTPQAWPGTFSEAEVAALELAGAVAGPAPQKLEAGLIERLRSHFDEIQLAELLAVAGEANFNNRVGNSAVQLLRG